MIVDKKVKLKLMGLDGNAFSLMGAFQTQAKMENWTPDEIEAVMNEAQSDDYNNLIRVLLEHCDGDE